MIRWHYKLLQLDAIQVRTTNTTFDVACRQPADDTKGSELGEVSNHMVEPGGVCRLKALRELCSLNFQELHQAEGLFAFDFAAEACNVCAVKCCV